MNRAPAQEAWPAHAGPSGMSEPEGGAGTHAALPQGWELTLLAAAFDVGPRVHATLQSLAQSASILDVGAGPLELASPCSPVPSWWLVCRGSVALGATGTGRFMERWRLGPGDWLDVAGALSPPGSWLCQAQCQGAVQLMSLPLTALARACQRDADLTLACGRVLATQVRRLNDQLQELCSADVGARVARWLLQGATQAGTGPQGARWRIRERKQDIAHHLSTTAESLSRALRRLCEAGVIDMRGYEITVRDAPRLQALAYPDEGRPRRWA